MNERVCVFSPRLVQRPGVHHGEKKQHDTVVSVRKSMLCQSTNNCRDSLCAGELEHPAAPCHWVSRIRSVYVCKYENETRDSEGYQHAREKEKKKKCGCMRTVCVWLFVREVEMKLGHSLQLSRTEDKLATEVG